MEIFIERGNKNLKKDFNGKAKILLKSLDINPETVIIVRNDTVVTEEDVLHISDKIRILSVISGG